MTRVVRPAVLLVAGAYLCVVGAIAHRHVTFVVGVEVPWGMILAVLTTYAMVLAAARIVRVGGAWFGMGWAAALTAQQLSPGGSYLVASDWLGWSFIAGSLGAIVFGVLRPNSLGQ